MNEGVRPLHLAALGFAGQGMSFLLAAVLARQLGVGGFEAYVIASAAYALMVAVAPLGTEKFALRVLPGLVARGDWARARAFLAFGVRRTLLASLIVGLAVGGWTWSARDLSGMARSAVVVACLALPAGALAHFGVGVLSALGRESRALALIRIAVPGVALAGVGIVLASSLALNGAMAVGCWGIAWGLGLAMIAIEIHRAAPPKLFNAQPAGESAHWSLESRPFLIYRISFGVLAQAGLIALDVLQPSSVAVGAYAAAMSTAGLMTVLATATNRAYARRLSIFLERRDFAAIVGLRNERLRWLLPALTIFVVVAFAYSRELLALFRPEFVADGVVPLRVLAVASAFSVIFAMAPTYLKYQRRTGITFVTVACAAAVQGLLLLLLVPRFGAAGAAMSQALSICGMFGFFAWTAHRELAVLRANC